MTVSVSSVTSVRSGLCPHGLPPAACPICSAMGGGNKLKTADFSAKPGEMSWNECAAIGAFLKSLKNARLAREADYQAHLTNIVSFERNMTKASQNLNLFIQSLNQNVLTKPLGFFVKNVVLPIIEGIKNVPAKVLSVLVDISQKLHDISDKLTAIYGELKAALNKRISDFFKQIKKKMFSIFQIFDAHNNADENELMVELERKLEQLKKSIECFSKKILEKKYATDK